MLARRLRVSETLPRSNGAWPDDIADYLPGRTVSAVLAVLPLLSSSYQLCQVDAKTGCGLDPGLRGSAQRFGEHLGWCHELEGLARAPVELGGDEVEVGV